jgi:hypothetical protein|tara:strand:- start:166 stop:726 length:561 start_codon:yes stop_codon:yes gene_type:complete
MNAWTMEHYFTFQLIKEVIMYKKLFGFAILSLFGVGSLLAGSSVFKAEGTCANKHSAMRTMGELPLHFAGEMNCIDRVQIKGEKIDAGSTCTYSGQTTLGQPPILSWTVTCQLYDAKGDSIFWRSSGSNPLAAGEGPGKTSIISGTGKYKGISGSGTMTWKQSVANVTDPMRWGHTYKGSLKIHMP